jgi:hypothetical protein
MQNEKILKSVSWGRISGNSAKQFLGDFNDTKQGIFMALRDDDIYFCKK